MKDGIVPVVLSVAVVLLTSCTAVPETVENLAGNNTNQLRAVLRHYILQPRKYIAARYLIDNMGHGYTENDSGIAYKAAVISSDAHTVAELNAVWYAVIDSLPSCSNKRRYVKDASTINSQYLIKNIDSAFEVWRDSPWKRQVGFREFCHHILPYRVLEEPLSDWRKPLHDKYWPLIEGETDLLRAYAIVYRRLVKDFDTFSLKCPCTPDVMLSDRLMTGICSQRCTYIVSVMRALGIPAACDFVHYWANYSPTGHSWVCLVPDSHITLTMQPQDSLPAPFKEIDASVFHVEGSFSSPSHFSTDSIKRASKVYRHSYEIHTDGFMSPFQYDVSQFYTQTGLSVTLPVKDCNVKLYTFASVNGWQPAANPSTRRGDKVVFNNIGGHIVYLLAKDNSSVSGADHQVLPPFILGDDSSVRFIEAVQDSLCRLVTRRKYVLYSHWLQRWSKLIGTRFEASDYADFHSCELLHEVTSMPEGKTSIAITPAKPYRYVRMQVRKDARPNVAELAYYGCLDSIVYGKLIAHDIDTENILKSTDGDYGTWSSSSTDHYWWGYDFGTDPPLLSRIEICMRHDMNMVEAGKKYQLFYFDDGWRSLGIQKATSDSLEWVGRAGALYWLHCLDGGREERIFTYENGRQVWW